MQYITKTDTLMKQTSYLLILSTISLFFFSCASNNTKSEMMTLEPDFADKGKTIDSLIKSYKCENIEYENWDKNDAVDSCLTVCLINSKILPSNNNPEKSSNQLKGIALSIKKALVVPQIYNSYYIIFVKKEKVFGSELKIHSDGMKIPNTELQIH